MKRFNLFYLVILLLGAILYVFLRGSFTEEISFYGFADSRATEINYNYAVVVDRILVKPGQAVKAGEELLHISRRKSKEVLEDQTFRIAELKAKENLQISKLQNEIKQLELNHQSKIVELDAKVVSISNELAYKKSLFSGLESIKATDVTYKPLEDDMARLKQQKSDEIIVFSNKLKGLQEELSISHNPYGEQIKRLMAEKEFDETQKIQPIVVYAPTDGLVGNISCKEAEHIPSYSTLMTFYEPHSGLIKGYVHEDLRLAVEIGQSFTISSLKDDAINYSGTIIGLGSRIVEIPARLRKMEVIKAYGREVLIEISKDNDFLQKEKVSIRLDEDYKSR